MGNIMLRWLIPVILLLVTSVTALTGWLILRRSSISSANRFVEIPELMWDFSAGNSTGVVSWPEGVQGHLWRVDERAYVTITIPGGKSDRYLVHSYQVRRDRGRITSIMLGMPCEPAQAAHDRAKTLAAEWGVLRRTGVPGESDPLRNLKEWYASHGPGGSGAGLGFCQMAGPYDDRPGCAVSIRRCYGEKVNGWYVTLAIGGFPDAAAPADAERSKPPTDRD